MKKIIIVFLALISMIFDATAQERSGILEKGEQSVGIASGIDYSIAPLFLLYNRGFNVFNYKYQVRAGLEFTMPLFSADLNDIRIRITSQTTFFKKNKFEIRGG